MPVSGVKIQVHGKQEESLPFSIELDDIDKFDRLARVILQANGTGINQVPDGGKTHLIIRRVDEVEADEVIVPITLIREGQDD